MQDGSAFTENASKPGEGGRRAADYLWRPWYAKIWWAAIPVYWLPAGGPTRIAALSNFYDTGYATVVGIIFTPLATLLVLGFGYFRQILANGDVREFRETSAFGPTRAGVLNPMMDELDPRSGSGWIGNPARNRIDER